LLNIKSALALFARADFISAGLQSAVFAADFFQSFFYPLDRWMIAGYNEHIIIISFLRDSLFLWNTLNTITVIPGVKETEAEDRNNHVSFRDKNGKEKLNEKDFDSGSVLCDGTCVCQF
jgi:hypothetical protein